MNDWLIEWAETWVSSLPQAMLLSQLLGGGPGLLPFSRDFSCVTDNHFYMPWECWCLSWGCILNLIFQGRYMLMLLPLLQQASSSGAWEEGQERLHTGEPCEEPDTTASLKYFLSCLLKSPIGTKGRHTAKWVKRTGFLCFHPVPAASSAQPPETMA